MKDERESGEIVVEDVKIVASKMKDESWKVMDRWKGMGMIMLKHENEKEKSAENDANMSCCNSTIWNEVPSLQTFSDVRFDSDLWGRRTPGVVVEVQPVDYFHMTCVRRWKFLFAFCGFNSQFQFAFCFFDLRLPVSTCVSSFRLAFWHFDVLTYILTFWLAICLAFCCFDLHFDLHCHF